MTTLRPPAWAGVLVPSSNPSVEPELSRCVLDSMTLFAARFPVMPGTTLQERNRRYLDLYRDSVRAFGTLRLASILIGLTGPSYRLLPEGDRALMRELSAVAGVPVITASAAIGDALTELGARRICLVSPYPQWLTDEAAGYWRAAGHEIVQVVKISDTQSAYDVTEEDVLAALARIDHAAIDAVVMSGTGMLTLPSILAARGEATKPFLSSNLCCAWRLLREAGLDHGSELFSRAAPELARMLAVKGRA